MLQSSRRKPGGSPTPGVVMVWRIRTTWPPPFSSDQSFSSASAFVDIASATTNAAAVFIKRYFFVSRTISTSARSAAV